MPPVFNEIFKYTFLPYGPKNHLSGKRSTLERNEVKSGIPMQLYNICRVPLGLVEINVMLVSFGAFVICAKIPFPKHYFVYKLQPKFIKLLS